MLDDFPHGHKMSAVIPDITTSLCDISRSQKDELENVTSIIVLEKSGFTCITRESSG